MIRNLRCTVTIDSVLANSKTQNAFLFIVNAIFRHDYPLAVEPAGTPRPLVQKKLGEILYLLICFLPCLSWLLRIRVRKSGKDLWIALYITRWYMVRTMSSLLLFVVVVVCCCFTLIWVRPIGYLYVKDHERNEMRGAQIIYVNHDYHCCQRYIRSNFFRLILTREAEHAKVQKIITRDYMYSTHDGKLKTKHT